MAVFMPGQVLSVEQFRYHEWDAVQWLVDVKSHRVQDTPGLGEWCNTYGEANGIDPRVLLAMLEKEQSFVTLATLSDHRHNWAMGFGVYPDGTHLQTWRGEPNSGPEMQIKHAAIRLRELADGADPGLTPNMGFELENGPTRALYIYNPSVSGNYNLWAIYHRWFGDGGGGGVGPAGAGSTHREPAAAATTASPRKCDVAEVANIAVDAHLSGHSTTTIHGVTFDLKTPGWCGKFVRQCYAAAYRKYDPTFDEFGFGWCAADAWQACIALKAQGYQVSKLAAEPGDIVGLNGGLTASSHGHMGIWLGDYIAENTTSLTRGPGTVRTRSSLLEGQCTGWYSVVPSSLVQTPGVAIVYPSDVANARRVDCSPYIGEDGRMYCQAAPLVTALGYMMHYREVPEGDRVVKRGYVKTAG